MTDPVLRKALPGDLETLLPLVAAYHRFEGIAASEAARRRAVSGLLEDPRLGTVWLAERAGRPIGYLVLGFGFSIEFGGRDAFVDELFVEAESRGQGVGLALLNAARTAAAADGLVALHLEVNRDNAGARRFYENEGFTARERFHLMSVGLEPDRSP